MVDPKHEPGFEPKHNHPEHPEKNNELKPKLKSLWRERMHSHLLRMSKGAQNLFRSIPWAHKDEWRRKDKKK